MNTGNLLFLFFQLEKLVVWVNLWIQKSSFSSERPIFEVTCKLGTVSVILILLNLIRNEGKGI